MTLHCLAILRPIDPATGERVAIRVASASLREITGLGGAPWEPAMVEPPRTSMRLFEGGFDSAVQPGSARMPVHLGKIRNQHPAVDSYVWAGAPVEIYPGQAGDVWPWTLHFAGRISSYSRDKDVLAIAASVDGDPFGAEVLHLNYAGTTGREGGADLKDRPKPLIIGHARNVEPVLIDAVDNVYQFSGYGPIEAVETLFERASAFGTPVGDFTDYDALVAATLPPGSWATCLAEGMVRLGAPAYGVITGDVRGHAVDGATPRLTGTVIWALANIAGVDGDLIDSDTLTSLNSAAPYPINLVLTSQVSFIEMARRLALPCNHQAGVSLVGRFFVAAIGFTGAEGTTRAEATETKELPVSPPYSRTILGAARSWRVHTADEIAFGSPLVDRGAYDAGVTYRHGDIVTMPNLSRWLYVADEPSSGNAPPDWPETSNQWWDNLTPPATASNISYEDGTPVESLKPAEPGATEGAPPGTNVGGKPAEDVISELEQHQLDIAAADAAILAAQQEIADLIATYGDTVSAGEAYVQAVLARDAAIAARDDAQVKALEAQGHATASYNHSQASEGFAEAAEGHANTASTERAAAVVARGQAVQAKEDAEGASAASATSAGLSADARDASAGHANASFDHSQTAGAYAGDAETSATAALTSELRADTSANGARLALAKQFPEAIDPGVLADVAPAGAPATVEPLSETHPSWVADNGASIYPPTGQHQIAHVATIPLRDGEIYDVIAEVEAMVGASATALYCRVLDASYGLITSATIGTRTDLAQGQRATLSQRVSRNSAIAGVQDFNQAGAAWLRVMVLINRATGSLTTDPTTRAKVHALFARPVTSEVAAETSASIAESAQVIATSEAASALSSSGTAATYRNQAQGFRDQSLGYRDTASSHASTATAQASIATAEAAAAQQSASLAASIGQGALNRNPVFADWPNAGSTPTGWGLGAGTLSRSAGRTSPYAAVLAATAGANSVALNQIIGSGSQRSVKQGDWLVLEGEVELVSGALSGAGVAVTIRNSAGTGLQNLTGEFGSGGTVGAVYPVRKLVQVTNANAFFMTLYAAGHLSWHGSIAAANSVRFLRCAVRYATEAEIRDQTVLAPLDATVTTQGQTLVNLNSAYASLSSDVSTMTVTVSEHATAIEQLGDDVDLALGSYGFNVTVNGRVSGMRHTATGQLAATIFETDMFGVVPPGGSGNGLYIVNDAQDRTTLRIRDGSVNVVELGWVP